MATHESWWKLANGKVNHCDVLLIEFEIHEEDLIKIFLSRVNTPCTVTSLSVPCYKIKTTLM